MKDSHHKQSEYREPFPYKTYEEILQEKERRQRFRHGMVIMSGIFLMFCAVIIGIGTVWNRNATPVRLLHPVAEDKAFDLSALTQAAGLPGLTGRLNTFTLPAPKELAVTAETSEHADLIQDNDVSAVVKKVRGSVVGIDAERIAGPLEARVGSGIILSADGYIITTSHVIEGCDSIGVTLDSGERYMAFVVGDDRYSDIAVLKIDAEDLLPAELGDSDRVEVGQPAVTIGNPTGQLQEITTFGMISGTDRKLLINGSVMHLLQTDTAIHPGNSGGPLLNAKGQVIGINSAKLNIEGYEGLGFAIPINAVRPIAEELVRSGSISARPMLGLTVSKLNAMASGFYGLPQGLYITSVDRGQTCGLQVGDVITHINDIHVTALPEAVLARDQFRAGDTITVTYFRGGITKTVELNLLDRMTVFSDSNL